MHKKIGLLLSLCLVISLSAIAQDDPANTQQTMTFTLQEAVNYGMENNVDVKNAEIDKQIAQSTVKEVKSQGLPQITGNVNFTDNTKLPVFIFPDPSTGQQTAFRVGNQFTTTAGLEATQLLFDGTFFLGLRAAKDFVRLSSLDVNRSKIDVKMSISKAYYIALISKENLTLIDSNLVTLRKTRDEIKAYYEEGLAEELDLDRLNLSVSQLEIQQKQLQDQYIISLKFLKLQMGLDVDSDIVLTDNLETLSVNYENDAAMMDTVNAENRVEYQMVDQQLQLINLDERRWKYGYYPTIEAFGNYNMQSFRDTFNYFDQWAPWYNSSYVGVRIRIPVFDGFYKQSKIQQARLDAEKAENTKENLEEAIKLEFFQARQTYLRSLETLNVQKKNLELAEKILNTTVEKQREGLGSSLDVVNAQNDYRQANLAYTNAVYELLVAQLDLKKATGTL